MQKLFTFDTIAADGKKARFKTSYIQLRCRSGWRGIMRNNGPLFALLAEDTMLYMDEQGVKNNIDIEGGILKIKDGRPTILTHSFALPDPL